jgi:hypothetical protein
MEVAATADFIGRVVFGLAYTNHAVNDGSARSMWTGVYELPVEGCEGSGMAGAVRMMVAPVVRLEPPSTFWWLISS